MRGCESDGTRRNSSDPSSSQVSTPYTHHCRTHDVAYLSCHKEALSVLASSVTLEYRYRLLTHDAAYCATKFRPSTLATQSLFTMFRSWSAMSCRWASYGVTLLLSFSSFTFAQTQAGNSKQDSWPHVYPGIPTGDYNLEWQQCAS